MKFVYFTLSLLLALHIPVIGQGVLSAEDITVLADPPKRMMREYMTSVATRQFLERDSQLSGMRTAADWDQRAEAIRDSIRSWTGPFPERTPLNPRITGRLDRDGYTVEKILFESRPGYLVSANLYLPEDVSFPRPAVLNVVGHWGAGKTLEHVQRRSIGQAKKGFVALTIDALGHGERKVPEVGNAHKTIGKQAFIAGTHLFNLMAWDVIRAIDYLESRPAVDKNNICITGASGGGMMSTYLLAVEDRIKVSVPTCNPNTYSPLIRGAGVGTDSEQLFFGAFRSLIDPRGDPLFVHVPKPLQINATTEDGNPPRGVWNLSTWLYKSYAAHGAPELLNTSMVKGPHGYNREQREAAYAWMMRWTGTGHKDFWEEDFMIEEAADLRASAEGNVFLEPVSRHPQELVLDYFNENRALWEPVTSGKELEIHRSAMTGLVGDALQTDLDRFMVKGGIQAQRQVGGMEIRSFVLEPEQGILLPGVLIGSEDTDPEKGVILYINVRSDIEDSYGKGALPPDGVSGKSALLEQQEILAEVLRSGYALCAVDLRGIGETGPYNEETNTHFACGDLIFAQRLRDVLTVIEWLRGPEVKAQDIRIWGTGMGALYGAFAGVLDKDISRFVLVEPLVSFESLIRVGIPQYGTEIIIPGILENFDMTQVYQALCPRRVIIINPRLGDRSMAGQADIEPVAQPVTATYRKAGRKKDFSMDITPGTITDKIMIKELTRR